MSRRNIKKQYTSDISVVDFQSPATVKKHRIVSLPRNQSQGLYLEALGDESVDVVIAVGPAGTGKSLLGMQTGIKMLQEGKVDRIVVTRPTVGVDEDIGFLPGTLNEKMAPWTRPLFDILYEHFSHKEVEAMLEEEIIEICPIGYVRGRTFKNTYLMFDESQLSTTSQMKAILTRIGEGSKLVITGDLQQADRKIGVNGLDDFLKKLKSFPSARINVTEFSRRDIERHPVVAEVLRIYGDEI
jgi:phosphate starvation-inducible protein PhoH and related proteins